MSQPLPPSLVGERVALSLHAMGATGQAWLDALPDLLAELADAWSISIGARLDGGRASYVAEATTRDGTPAVVKVAIPPDPGGITPYDRQLAALRLAGGDPYVRLIRYDVPRQALLLERLGRPMATLGWPVAHQLAALTRIAARGWCPVPDDDRLPEAARWHAAFVPATWEALGRPCSAAAVDLAVRCAAVREAAFRPGEAVLVHGDVHAFNALRTPGPGVGFRLVDPLGLVSEPAHDLGVIQARGVRWRLDELAADDPRRALRKLIGSCRRAGRATGVDPEAVRQWAYVELVSTGLHVLRLGDREDAEMFLVVADKLAAAAGAGSAAGPGLAVAAPATSCTPPSAAATSDTAAATSGTPLSGAATPGTVVAAVAKADRARSAKPSTPGHVTAEGLPCRRASPEPDDGRPGRAELFLMVGLPGAGKTTRAKQLAAERRALRLTPDEWMISLFDGIQPDGKRDLLEGRLIALALEALRAGTDVVLDFGLWSRDERSALRGLATAAGAACQVVYLPVGRDVQRARIARREATAPHTTFPMSDADLDLWWTQFEVPDAVELGGGDIPGPPAGWPGWPEWATDRWPSLADSDVRPAAPMVRPE